MKYSAWSWHFKTMAENKTGLELIGVIKRGTGAMEPILSYRGSTAVSRGPEEIHSILDPAVEPRDDTH
ncbi:MAG: hypothetical protein OER98_08070 [Gammaproteobacteria bacterium]|nr:hypothetical protein [Gammaproteobacteria bacterium]